ncbi:MAG: metallophosphoesterase [Corallococcus sp.]|nr:metallophosphoesterase [Corallococcus sp.]
MKVFAISDLHLATAVEKPMTVFGTTWNNYFEKITEDWKSKVADEDIVLLAGDFSWAMRMEEVIHDFDLLKDFPGSKVIIRGNHDYWWNSLSKVRSVIPSGFFALQNDCLRFGKLLVCGSRGWVCPDVCNSLSKDDDKIYRRERERLELSLKAMSAMRTAEDIVIGMMHYPPFNGRFDESLYTQLFVKYDVNKVVYGHLHGKDCRAERHLKKFGIDFYLTSCDLVDNKLIQITEI